MAMDSCLFLGADKDELSRTQFIALFNVFQWKAQSTSERTQHSGSVRRRTFHTRCRIIPGSVSSLPGYSMLTTPLWSYKGIAPFVIETLHFLNSGKTMALSTLFSQTKEDFFAVFHCPLFSDSRQTLLNVLSVSLKPSPFSKWSKLCACVWMVDTQDTNPLHKVTLHHSRKISVFRCRISTPWCRKGTSLVQLRRPTWTVRAAGRTPCSASSSQPRSQTSPAGWVHRAIHQPGLPSSESSETTVAPICFRQPRATLPLCFRCDIKYPTPFHENESRPDSNWAPSPEAGKKAESNMPQTPDSDWVPLCVCFGAWRLIQPTYVHAFVSIIRTSWLFFCSPTLRPKLNRNCRRPNMRCFVPTFAALSNPFCSCRVFLFNLSNIFFSLMDRENYLGKIHGRLCWLPFGVLLIIDTGPALALNASFFWQRRN